MVCAGPSHRPSFAATYPNVSLGGTMVGDRDEDVEELLDEAIASVPGGVGQLWEQLVWDR